VNASEIVAEIESAGGILTLDGGQIAYKIPPSVRSLLGELRARKLEVLEILRARESADCAQRFHGQSHAKLFSFIGRKVRTPSGPGTLIQVFIDRCTVVLDSQVSQCARLPTEQVEPVSRELSV
jgi:hypothetical protein